MLVLWAMEASSLESQECTQATAVSTEKSHQTADPVIHSISPTSSEPSSTPATLTERISSFYTSYCRKLYGVDGKSPPKFATLQHIVLSSLFASIGIILVAIVDYFYLEVKFTTDPNDLPVQLMLAAYGATAVLIYDAYQSPLAQPRNVLGGFLVSSFCGVTTRIICKLIGLPIYPIMAFSVAVAMAGMNLTKTVHPPGGACALVAVIGGPKVHPLHVIFSFIEAWLSSCT